MTLALSSGINFLLWLILQSIHLVTGQRCVKNKRDKMGNLWNMHESGHGYRLTCGVTRRGLSKRGKASDDKSRPTETINHITQTFRTRKQTKGVWGGLTKCKKGTCRSFYTIGVHPIDMYLLLWCFSNKCTYHQLPWRKLIDITL